jgi:hypothetical protein
MLVCKELDILSCQLRQDSGFAQLTLSTISSDGQNFDIHPRALLCPVV